MMRNMIKKQCGFVAAALTTLWASAVVWGDDTEIFFGNFDGGNFLPNVLFVMDTSGSMGAPPDLSTPEDKVDIVKEALKQLAVEMSGVNVGLMRFSNPGGPVLYPVTYIDQEISAFGEGAQTVVSRVSSPAFDATENLDTGAVTLNSGTSAAGTGQEVVTQRLRPQGNDEDTYGNTGSYNEVYQDYLYLYGPGSMVGVRFAEADIPPGALITSAHLSMQAQPIYSPIYNRGSVDVELLGDPVPAADFDSGSGDGTGERSTTADSVTWTMNDTSGQAPSPGTVITSPDLSSVIQELIDDGDWMDGGISNNDLVLLLRYLNSSDDDGRRLMTAYEYDTDASSLLVTYIPDGVSATDQDFASGLWFGDVAVPQGATVTSATLELVPTNTVGGTHDLAVGIEASSNPTVFTGADGEISSRLASASTETLTVDSWTDGVAVSLDVTNLVNSKVAGAGWCGGRDMSFLVESRGDRLDWMAYEGDSGFAPVLRVTYDADSVAEGATCIEGQQSQRVSSSLEDVESLNSSGSSYTTNRSYISIESDDWAALRFGNYPLPSDATVTGAYLYLTAYDTNSNSGTISLSVENVADSEPLTASGGIQGRSWVGSVGWSIGGSGAWTDLNEYRSPDISALINSVLERGFTSGNALTLRIDHVSGTTRTFSTYERNPIYAARLVVNFESSGNDAFNTARTEFMTAVDSLSAEGFTPIQDTLFEAYNYYAGNPVVWGKYRGGHDENGNRINVANESIDTEPFWYTRVSVEESITDESFAGVVRPLGCTEENLSSTACDDPNGPGQPEGEYLAGSPVYKTPIAHECQFKSHVVFLTDGAANEPHSESLIKNAIGAGSCPYGGNSAQRCVVELAEHMFKNDMIDELDGEQKVITHMVGFDFDEQWLEDIANAGGGIYATANSLETLVEEFKAIIAEVMKTDTSFVAPVAAINQFNRLTNLDDVYFAVFKPDSTPAWLGNLKRYRLGEFGGEANVLLDANGVPAVDANTGFFRSSAQSYWSSAPDGADVTLGGAAEMIPSYTTRRIFTDTTGTPALLSATANRIEPGNSDLTAVMLGVDTTQRTELIDWIRGKDTQDQDGDTITSEDRFAINDPLHSRPVAVTYGQDVDGDSDVTLFFGTNSGNLHAVDANTGVEVFSYIPGEMLELQADVRANDGGIGHYYGLDGSPAVWTKNIGSPAIDGNEGDHVYLYIGQRRGGRNYYALDVTDRSAPRLMWKIKGGEGDFGDLGQSWARPIPGKLNIDGINRDVLYISGGYDLSNDNESLKNATSDAMGNAMYIVDANTGQRIWSVGEGAGHTMQQPEMIHSIPATATVYDVDSDGLDDGMFIGDTGGQVWRFDFKQGEPPVALATGGIVARVGLGGSTQASENRRFFHAPDVALADIDGKKKLVVTIGSGSRPSPLSEVVNDRFYAFFQDAVFGPPSSYVSVLEGDDPATPVTETSDLYDATDNLIQTGDADQVAAELSELQSAGGWFIDLERSGEKVLSTPLSFRNSVSFTTYQPVNEEGSCTPKAGTSRLYLVDLYDATASEVFGDDANPDSDAEPSRDYALDTPSIVDEPVIICTGDGCELFAGPEQPPVELLAGGQIVRTYWRQDQ